MSVYSQFAGMGGKPKQVTTYTSGSGTYTPVAPNSWCFVTLVGAGGAGGSVSRCYGFAYSQPGGGGKVIQRWTKVVSTASYAVGAAAYWYQAQAGSYPHYYYYYTRTTAGATTFNGLSAAGGYNGADSATGDTSTAAGALVNIWSGPGFQKPMYEYSNGNYGSGGGATSAGNSNGCGGPNYGGSGVAGFIMIEDFGP